MIFQWTHEMVLNETKSQTDPYQSRILSTGERQLSLFQGASS